MDGVEFYYFAYGSNLSYLRMLERTSIDLLLKGKFAWRGCRLTFAKRSADGSGKCTAMPTTDDHVVWGAIYRLTLADKRKLATFEVGYQERSLMLPVDGVQKLGFTFIADTTHIDRSLRPYKWYKRLVVAGAREQGFPSEYIDEIDRIEPMIDPDAGRCASYDSILAQIENARRV